MITHLQNTLNSKVSAIQALGCYIYNKSELIMLAYICWHTQLVCTIWNQSDVAGNLFPVTPEQVTYMIANKFNWLQIMHVSIVIPALGDPAHSQALGIGRTFQKISVLLTHFSMESWPTTSQKVAWLAWSLPGGFQKWVAPLPGQGRNSISHRHTKLLNILNWFIHNVQN